MNNSVLKRNILFMSLATLQSAYFLMTLLLKWNNFFFYTAVVLEFVLLITHRKFKISASSVPSGFYDKMSNICIVIALPVVIYLQYKVDSASIISNSLFTLGIIFNITIIIDSIYNIYLNSKQTS